jgi:hypothetical protein
MARAAMKSMFDVGASAWPDPRPALPC